jgi:hypothetical protein
MSIPTPVQEEARRVIEGLPEGLQIGSPLSHGRLTVFPLKPSEAPGKARYVTLDQALAAGKFRVTEVSKEGRVPELCVVNESDAPVLLLDGEELVGAKQNRVLNVTVLVPAHRTIVVPVSCVEAGRWAQAESGENFGSAKHVMFAALRKSSSSKVQASARAGRGYGSDQSLVWDHIARKSDRMGSSSDTGAMSAMFKDRERELDRSVAAITADDDQVGAAFCIGDRLAGIELFDQPSTLRALLPKLVRSYAMDAIEVTDDSHAVPDVDAVKNFVRDIARSNKEVRRGVGLGEDVRLSAPTLVGGALVFEGRVVHLSAFPEEGADGTDETTDASTSGSWLSSLRRRRSGRK